MLRQSDSMWQATVDLHETSAPFSLRPLTTQTTIFIAHATGLSLKWSFVLNQYLLLFLLFLSFAVFLRKLGMNKRDRIIGLIVLGTAYPILCLHFIPNYTWDDLWLYLGVVWMSYFLVDGRVVPAAFVMLLSALGREHILMFAPMFFVWGRPRNSYGGIIAALLIPIIGYGLYRYFQFPEIAPGRFAQWAKNFANAEMTRQTLYSLFISFGWLWAAFLLAIQAMPNDRSNVGGDNEAKLRISALIMTPLAVAVVLFMVTARETRIFFPPFVYLVPLGVLWIKTTGMHIARGRNIQLYILWLIILAGSVLLSIWLFPRFEFLPMIDFHRVLFALNLTLGLFILAYGRKSHPAIQMPDRKIQSRSE
jgi:hypothetical protein